MTTFNVRTARLRSGEQFRDVREVELEPLELGGSATCRSGSGRKPC